MTFPSTYQDLAAYALNLINQDRSGFKLAPVMLGPNPVAQQHADSMLYYGYFSHYDTQGYKPYMRYTLLGGVGAVEENVAFVSWGGPHFLDLQSVEVGINSLEHAMMYNDSACCNNGHRMNILGSLHNRVSIGIAYNSTRAYFVEDFENYYINLNYSAAQGTVTLKGLTLNSPIISKEMAVFFDPTPTPQNTSELDRGPRQYDPGTLIGWVLPPCRLTCSYFQSGITVHATIWNYDGSQISIAFSMSSLTQQYRAGVYTLYLITGNNTNAAITSISIFVG